MALVWRVVGMTLCDGASAVVISGGMAVEGRDNWWGRVHALQRRGFKLLPSMNSPSTKIWGWDVGALSVSNHKTHR